MAETKRLDGLVGQEGGGGDGRGGVGARRRIRSSRRIQWEREVEPAREREESDGEARGNGSRPRPYLLPVGGVERAPRCRPATGERALVHGDDDTRRGAGELGWASRPSTR
jgi:hypothetical protein